MYRASDNSQKKKSNFAGFAETNSGRKQLILREFSGQISPKAKKKPRRKIPEKKIYWKDVKFRARKKTQNFIQHSSKVLVCTCFKLQEKHKLYRNTRPVNLLFQLQFRAKHGNAINFFSLFTLLCCFAVYKARLFVIEGSNPFVKSKHCCVFERVLHVRLNMCLGYALIIGFHTPRDLFKRSNKNLLNPWGIGYKSHPKSPSPGD